ncbi:MAG TPA: hypothetical protein VFT71_03415 [Candidatus Nitrosocosmicus sp.]|nr:hypothetical protein [Candidatus Nitrosocosmicus sp.]
MRTFHTFAVMLLLLGATSLLSLANGNSIANGLCSEITDPNVSCHEQHNSRSNVETTTSTTTEEEEEVSPLLCSDLKCNLGEEYIMDQDSDIADPLDLLD